MYINAGEGEAFADVTSNLFPKKASRVVGTFTLFCYKSLNVSFSDLEAVGNDGNVDVTVYAGESIVTKYETLKGGTDLNNCNKDLSVDLLGTDLSLPIISAMRPETQETGKTFAYQGTSGLTKAKAIVLTNNAVDAKITKQPTDITVNLGAKNIKFAIETIGNPAVTYQWQKYENKKWINVTDGNAKTYIVKNATAGMTLRCVVKNTTTQDNTVVSKTVKLTVKDNTLSKVTKLKIKKKGYEYISLAWNKVKDATSYDVYYKAIKDDSFKLYKSVKNNKCKVSDLKEGTTYKFYVVARKDNIKSKKSSKVAGKTKANSMEFDLKKISDAEIQVTWELKKGAIGYQISNNHTRDRSFKLNIQLRVIQQNTRAFTNIRIVHLLIV